jgi:hypothetical protein
MISNSAVSNKTNTRQHNGSASRWVDLPIRGAADYERAEKTVTQKSPDRFVRRLNVFGPLFACIALQL